MTNNYSESLESDETMDDFCRGTGYLNYSSFESWANYYFTEEDTRFLEEHHIIVKYQNDTSSNWVNGRVVLTTDEWNSLQANGVSFKIKVEANEGIWVSEQGNTMTAIPYEINNYRNNVKEIYFNKMDETSMYNAYNAATIKADITYNNEGKVLLWLETDTIDNSKYIMYIASDGVTSLTEGKTLFAYYGNVEKIVFGNINTSRVSSMENMFRECFKLDNVDISMFDTRNVTTMQYMFKYCQSLENIIIGNLNLEKLNNMMGVFQYCSSIKSVDLSGTKTSIVANMQEIFFDCYDLESVNLSRLGSNNLTSITHLFYNCESLTTINMSNFNFGSASMQSLFDGLTNLEVVNLKNANTSNVPSMRDLFFESGIKNVDLSGLGGNSLQDIYNMFYGCNNIESINMSNFNFGSAYLYQLFAGITTVEIIDISNIDISNTVNAAYNMFYNCPSLTTIYVSSDIDFSTQPSNMSMFGNNTSLVGGAGTPYDENNPRDNTYAHIDGGESNPGYFTLKTS